MSLRMLKVVALAALLVGSGVLACTQEDPVDNGDAADSDDAGVGEDVDDAEGGDDVEGDDVGGGDDTGVPDDADVGEAPDDGLDRYDDLEDHEIVWTVFGEMTCEMAWECPGAHGEAASSLEGFGRFDSKSQCVDAVDGISITESDSDDERRAIEEGRIAIDRTHLADCRDELLDLVCDMGLFNTGVEFDEDHSCMKLRAGQLEEGDYCNMSDECGGDLRCIDDAETDDQCYRVCTVPEEEGGCGGEECGYDEYCDHSLDGGPSCVLAGEEGDECTWNGHCQSELLCTDDDVCSPIVIRDEGEACQPGEDFCATSTSCSSANGQECTKVAGEGDSCTAMVDCHYDLACVDGECARPDIGESCSEHFHCDGGYCDGDDEVCAPFYDEGEECSSYYECGPDAECDLGAGECVGHEVCELPDGE